MPQIELVTTLLLLGAALLMLGVLSSVMATRFGAPLLLVFLVLGMLAGEEGPGGIVFNDFALTYLIGSAALAVILFDGGLRTRLSAFRGVVAPALLLSTVGVVATAALTAGAAVLLLGISWWPALLLGSIVAATDAAAVFVLLRAGGLQLRRRIGSILEIESGSNDPMAVFLTFMIVAALQAPAALGWGEVAIDLLREAGLGTVLGLLGGLAICWLVNHIELAEGLRPLLVVAAAVLLFALTTLLHGSGYLAVFIAGLVVGNRPVRAYASIVAFHDTATWLCQITMFLILGLLATPSRLLAVAPPALAIAAFLMLIGRPAAVWLCLAPFGYSSREIAFVGWVGLRGAVSIFLATVPLLSGLPGALTYFDVAFFVVLVSLLLQGWTIQTAARRLGQSLPRTSRTVYRVELDLPGQLEQELVGYHVIESSPLMADRRLPGWARPVLVIRNETILSPAEAGPIQADDYVYMLAPPERVTRLDRLFATGGRAEPGGLGEFTLDASTSLAALGDLYGVSVPGPDQSRTIAELFADRFEDQLQPGDQLPFGEATLVVREMDEDRAVRVGLILEALPSAGLAASLARQHIRQWLASRRSAKTVAGVGQSQVR
jgi:cell volume regulation protein A